MPGIVRADVDTHIGHASPTKNPFHKTSYVASLNSDKVFIEGHAAIVIGDSTACGDPATGGSGKVFVKGIGVHRIGDSTGGHGSWVANSAATGSGRVFAA